jgi:hypothetical protein
VRLLAGVLGDILGVMGYVGVYGVCKHLKKYILFREQSKPDLELATGDPDINNFGDYKLEEKLHLVVREHKG